MIQALHDWPFAVWLRPPRSFIPRLKPCIVAIAITFDLLWLVDLRLLGVRLGAMAMIDTRALAGAALPWTLIGFSLAAAAGSLMFLARAGTSSVTVRFSAKILLLFVAATNAGILHSRGPLDARSKATRLQTGFHC